MKFLACLLLAATVAPAQTTGEWKLVWADEFDRDGPPDPSRWTYEKGFVRNSELQWYQPDNAACRNGILTIEGRRERVRNPDFRPDSADWRTRREFAEYTSTSMTTRGIQTWLYGRFEMRGRIDTRGGLWPAWWTLGAKGNWPANGEVDIMEYYQGMLLANLIWAGGRSTTSFTVRIPLKEFNDPGWSAKFHVWRMDWDENRIVLSVDGMILNDADLNKTFNPDGSNPYRHAHYMLLNLAIGGDAGGDPSATQFPARLEADYVRVYQRR
jgi:beta-glucanase (GH16 family)